jgi:hypothetical protein
MEPQAEAPVQGLRQAPGEALAGGQPGQSARQREALAAGEPGPAARQRRPMEATKSGAYQGVQPEKMAESESIIRCKALIFNMVQ